MRRGRRLDWTAACTWLNQHLHGRPTLSLRFRNGTKACMQRRPHVVVNLRQVTSVQPTTLRRRPWPPEQSPTYTLR